MMGMHIPGRQEPTRGVFGQEWGLSLPYQAAECHRTHGNTASKMGKANSGEGMAVATRDVYQQEASCASEQWQPHLSQDSERRQHVTRPTEQERRGPR